MATTTTDDMRSKCEQVVMECLRKIFEIVVQSRVYFQPERAKNTTSLRPRVRRNALSPLDSGPLLSSRHSCLFNLLLPLLPLSNPNPRSAAQFNLHVDEVQFIRNFVNESRLYQPLTIDIFWDSQAHGARGGGLTRHRREAAGNRPQGKEISGSRPVFNV